MTCSCGTAYLTEDGPIRFPDNRPSDHYVTFNADGTEGRRSRASRINAARRAYEREHGVTLTLISKSYSETYGFLSQSSFRYKREATP